MTGIVETVVDQYLRNYPGKPSEIALAKSPFEGLSSRELAQQLSGLRVARDKWPLWYKNNSIIYPPKINLEQSSSELTARYKAGLINGDHLVDITAGMGVDAYWFSQQVKRVDGYELNETLVKITNLNLRALNATHAHIHYGDGINAISAMHPDWIYVDPSRRNKDKGKVFMLADCSPDLTIHLDNFLVQSASVMIKTSPMLDISQGLRELSQVREVHVVAVKGEVKELLWICSRDYSGPISVVSVNLLPGDQMDKFQSVWGQFDGVPPKNKVLKFLYDPNPAMLKAGQQDEHAIKVGLSKLSAHTHIYTSDKDMDYPGRQFEVLEMLPYKRSLLKQKLKPMSLHVISRNFPMNVSQLRAKWKLKEGGDQYLFFVRNHLDEKIVIRAKRC